VKISIDIPDNQVFSFIELTKNTEYKITIDELDKLPKEFIEILDKREKTPNNQCISARDLIAEVKKRRHV
jgi:hypothetical protein